MAVAKGHSRSMRMDRGLFAGESLRCSPERGCSDRLANDMSRLTRRSLLKKAITEAAAASLAAPAVLSAGIATDTAGRKGRIKQSVSRWCFEGIPLEELCKKGGAMGLRGVDLLNEDE